MSERTTIGGTVYESIGSSSSNLLLKCNGTARIQWGNRLIDLIKNGKIASGDSSTQIYVISDESEIKSDGVYVLSKEESLQLLICKDDEQYNITNTDLYISAKTKQDITVEQRQQALENIGMYYNTLEEVQQAGIQNGLVYVLSDQNLYTVKDGVVAEFEAKLKTVTVEKEQQEGEVIKSNVSIVLSVLDTDYMIVGNGKIIVNYPVQIKESASIESENATDERGYRLYIDSDGSHLDVDYINVRTGLQSVNYIETTYNDFYNLLSNASLKEHSWYLIIDYKNPWQCRKRSSNTRPILVQALTTSSLYPNGKLFQDQRVTLTYDPHFKHTVKLDPVTNPETNEVLNEETTTLGRITQMTDANNNTANFDFLDYGVEEDSDIILHASIEHTALDSSIFPVGSFNNTLIVNNLLGTVLDSEGNFGGTSKINFKYVDVVPLNTESLDETITDVPENDTSTSTEPIEDDAGEESEDAAGEETQTELILMQMHDNKITCEGIVLEASCTNFVNNTFDYITDSTPITNNIINSSFGNIANDTRFNDCSFKNVQFKDITNCQFGSGPIQDVTSQDNIANFTISGDTHPLLYDTSRSKQLYVSSDGTLQVLVTKEQTFFRGMIVMHAGNAPIPEGWGICDGRIVEYNGEQIQTPNLIGNFIKAVGVDQCGPGGSSEITIGIENLPSHTHTYDILTEDSKKLRIHEGDDLATTSISQYTIEHTQTEATGSGKAITIDPKHYGLIFIMKL